MVAVTAARAARLRDDVSAVDRLSLPYPESRVVRIAGAERAGVLDADVLAVAAHDAAHYDSAGAWVVCMPASNRCPDWDLGPRS